MKVVVAGDVMLELSGRLPTAFKSVQADLLVYGDIVACVGGSAANFALAAVPLFDVVVVVAAVGDDSVGEVVRGEFDKHGVRSRLSVKQGLCSAVSIYIRDPAVRHAKGARLLFVGEPSALCQWDHEDAAALRPELLDADFLVVDGYALREEPRRGATLALMADAGALGVQVVYDVVPHDVFREARVEDVRRYAQAASIIVVEARTLNALAGEEWIDADADETAARRAAAFGAQSFRGRRMHIRFGLGNADRTLSVSPDGGIEIALTGYADSGEPRGFGDRLLAAELSGLLRAQQVRGQ